MLRLLTCPDAPRTGAPPTTARDPPAAAVGAPALAAAAPALAADIRSFNIVHQSPMGTLL